MAPPSSSTKPGGIHLACAAAKLRCVHLDEQPVGAAAIADGQDCGKPCTSLQMEDSLPKDFVQMVGRAVAHGMHSHDTLQPLAPTPDASDLEDERVCGKCCAHALRFALRFLCVGEEGCHVRLSGKPSKFVLARHLCAVGLNFGEMRQVCAALSRGEIT